MPTRTTTAVMDKDTGRSAVADDFLHAAPPRAANAPAAPAYTAPARALHWITAVLILFMIPTGFMAANEWGGSLQDSLYDLHKSIGALIIAVITVRLVYRWRHRPLPLPADVPPLQRLAAEATHWALYALLVLQPLIGWIATSAYPAPVPVFGWVTLPPIWPADRALSEQLFSVHRLVGIAIACLVTAHVAGALYHHFARKDRVLMRMISG
jgi:cytochrome b561